MHYHLIGICGTAMASLAGMLQARGHRVTGSDENVYPPMSTMLAGLGIGLMQGYDAAHLEPAPDCVVVETRFRAEIRKSSIYLIADCLTARSRKFLRKNSYAAVVRWWLPGPTARPLLQVSPPG